MQRLSAGEGPSFVNDLEAQTRAAMDGIKQTLDASGASFKDVVHYFVFRARPRMGDIGKASAVINSYFAPFKPRQHSSRSHDCSAPRSRVDRYRYRYDEYTPDTFPCRNRQPRKS
jgi:enamine deaminase RidA (YjgF/YER057c/UK114 family)